jgi:hypothetical protein
LALPEGNRSIGGVMEQRGIDIRGKEIVVPLELAHSVEDMQYSPVPSIPFLHYSITPKRLWNDSQSS